MNPILFCAFVLLSINLVDSKESCPYNDLDCITRGAKNVYTTLLNGVEGFQGIEPLILDSVNGKIPGFKYVLTNATLSPMKNCEPNMRAWTETSYEYVLQCSQLTLSANVVAKGRLGSVDVDGTDYVTITATDYTIITKGQQNIFEAKDGSKKFVLLNTNFSVDTVCQGNIIFECTNQFGLTKAQAEVAGEYFRNNWKVLENTFRYPTITKFMENLVLDKIGKYASAFTVDQIIPK